jgi:hypothetical protein
MTEHKEHRLIEAYEHMLEQVHELFETAEEKYRPKLHEAIETAQKKAFEIGKLSQDEAEKVAGYLKRDLTDMGQYLNDTGKDFRDWFKFDMEVIENRFKQLLINAADRTSLELSRLKERMEVNATWHSGEVTGPGTLVCDKCGQEVHFEKTSHIPPCPKCHATVFRRPT